MKILITGMAGFIGFHLATRLVKSGHEIIGLDSINSYYDPEIKYKRLAELGVDVRDCKYGDFVSSSTICGLGFVQMNLEDKDNLQRLFDTHSFDAVCNLAAQAGVRYSLKNPSAYTSSNIEGFLNVLEACRHSGVENLSYASSSSVYGLNESLPFTTSDNVDHPISLYAATKKANELMAHTYSHLYGIRTTGLRFFTVYGPWGRPDMALFLFVEAALKGEPIKVFNNGDMLRDFTYVDDITAGIELVINNPAQPDKNWTAKHPNPSSSAAAYKVYNIGNNNPVKLSDFISSIELALGVTVEKELMPIQDGDVPATFADVTDLVNDLGYSPSTSLEIGISNFVKWYRSFYNL